MGKGLPDGLKDSLRTLNQVSSSPELSLLSARFLIVKFCMVPKKPLLSGDTKVQAAFIQTTCVSYSLLHS